MVISFKDFMVPISLLIFKIFRIDVNHEYKFRCKALKRKIAVVFEEWYFFIVFIKKLTASAYIHHFDLTVI